MNAYQKALNRLAGLPLTGIGRAADMMWLHIGPWALHIQCDWSLSRRRQTILSSDDFRRAPDGRAQTMDAQAMDAQAMDDGDAIGRTRFDVVAADLRARLGKAAPSTASVLCDETGGFSLLFDDDSRLDVRADRSGGENWRLFRRDRDGEHFVVPEDRG